MLKRHKSITREQIAVDPGSHYTRIYSALTGTVLTQPSVGLLDLDSQFPGKVDLFGDRAVDQVNRQDAEHENQYVHRYRLTRPVQSDQHNDLGLRLQMLRYFIQQWQQSAHTKKQLEVSLVIPHDCDDTTSREWAQTCIASGAVKVELIPSALASFHGVLDSHNPASSSEPQVVIDLGGTESRLIAIVDNKIVQHLPLACGGDAIDDAIRTGIYESFGLIISDDVTQSIKHNIAAATPDSLVQHSNQSMQISGLSIQNNASARISIDTNTISQILKRTLYNLHYSIRLAFASLDPDIKDAVYQSAIQLCGGGAQLSRIDQLVMHATDLPVEIVNRPTTCSVRGAAAIAATPKANAKLPEIPEIA